MDHKSVVKTVRQKWIGQMSDWAPTLEEVENLIHAYPVDGQIGAEGSDRWTSR